MGNMDAVDAPQSLSRDEVDHGVGFEVDLAFRESADAHLRALNVLQRGYRQVEVFGDLSHPGELSAVGVMIAVGEVEAGDVQPGFDQLPNLILGVDRRAEGGDDFRLPAHKGTIYPSRRDDVVERLLASQLSWVGCLARAIHSKMS